ncbi:MAG TPA: M23 family metallopeptidase [Sphingobium sp.]
MAGAVALAGALGAAMPAQAKTISDDPYGDASEINASPLGPADVGFSNLFSSLQRLDGGAKPANYIPSGRPVEKLTMTSNFGVRSDPFNGGARMHKGIDIPGPVGTPIYATADGVVSRAGWASGYGNLVQISHGGGLETRYGHMSRLIVAANSYVHRGQLIGLMGSTGRSTGSHLHYEVRVDGQAVNPMPFVAGPDYLVAMNTKPPVALGGPTKAEENAAE